MVLLSREKFKELVFARDNHKCVICLDDAVDAHHIIDRSLWPDGGYYIDNGASLCEQHHLAAEMTKIRCSTLRSLCEIKNIILPPHFDATMNYDKWGNPYVDETETLRYTGELYYDKNVETILRNANIYDTSFIKKIKYPRTYHLPWSSVKDFNDRVLSNIDTNNLLADECVVTVKLDGENCTMYHDAIHARSLDSKGGVDRDWVKGLWAKIKHDIPRGWRICGENLYAKHSLSYKDLPGYFIIFSIWDDKNVCQSWDDTVTFAKLLDVPHVPQIARGCSLKHNDIMNLLSTASLLPNEGEHEGYVIRTASEFKFSEFRTSVAKFVRKDHVQTDEHWRNSQIVKNALR